MGYTNTFSGGRRRPNPDVEAGAPLGRGARLAMNYPSRCMREKLAPPTSVDDVGPKRISRLLE